MNRIFFLHGSVDIGKSWEFIETELIGSGYDQRLIHAPTLVASSALYEHSIGIEYDIQYVNDQIIRNNLTNLTIICHEKTLLIALALLQQFPDRIENIILLNWPYSISQQFRTFLLENSKKFLNSPFNRLPDISGFILKMKQNNLRKFVKNNLGWLPKNFNISYLETIFPKLSHAKQSKSSVNLFTVPSFDFTEILNLQYKKPEDFDPTKELTDSEELLLRNQAKNLVLVLQQVIK